MKNKVAFLLFIGYASCARLDNLQYLPPQGQRPQGGAQPAGQYQPAPFAPQAPAPQSYSGQPSTQYGTPAGTPSSQYGAPSGPATPSGQPSDQYGSPAGPAGPSGPRSPLADVPILRLDSENPGDGTYKYAYETGNDIAAQEEGSAQSGWNQAQGSYRFVSPEGQSFEVTYTADKNGYVPQGAHLPTPPPIPDAILKSLEVIRQAEASGNILEGAYQPEGDDGQYRESHEEGQYNPQQGGAKGYPGSQQPTGPNGGYRY